MIGSDPTAHVKSSPSSVHRLSYDDLRSIFTLCWKPGDNTFPIVASHVCRRWRWFILDMPVFWGHLHFHHKAPGLLSERYKTWIQRSKGVRLDISINNEPFEDTPDENIEDVMEMIGPHMERWRSLRIDQVSGLNIRIFLKHLKDRSLTQLKFLRIAGTDKVARYPAPSWSLGQLEFDAPQLKGVELVAVRVDFNSPLFHNLHTLDLTGCCSRLQGVKDLIHKLNQHSPHLKRLSIKQRGFFPSAQLSLPINEEPSSHASLLDLTLGFPEHATDALIPSIKFPALRLFRPIGRFRLTLESWHLPVLIRNSPFPSLEEIQLAGNPHDRQHDRHLAEALTTLPSLTWLQLVYFDISQVTDAILDLGHLCPRLQTLQIDLCTRVDLNLVRSLVDMRLGAHGITKLRELTVRGGIGDASPELRATKAWLKERVECVILEADHGFL